MDFAVRGASARRAGGKLIASARMHESRFLTQFISAAQPALSAVTLLFLLNACKTSQPETRAAFPFRAAKTPKSPTNLIVLNPLSKLTTQKKFISLHFILNSFSKQVLSFLKSRSSEFVSMLLTFNLKSKRVKDKN